MRVMVEIRRVMRMARCGLFLSLAGLLGPEPLQPQSADAFLDPAAEGIFRSAQANWLSIDESVVRYTAVIQQRIAAGIRTPLKDRTLYRSEVAVRAFWDRDHESLVQVLGSRQQHPGSGEEQEDPFAWLGEMPFDDPFEPGGDRLFFGIGGNDESIYSPDNEDFWFAHPLARGADTLYRFQSGDTLTLSLPDGRRLRTVQLDVLPREADVHRISGTLWIEPESGALVRGVYRLARKFDVMRDVAEVREEAEAGEFDMVPGILKPWTFDLSVVAVDYSFWEFKVWLPRSMRVEGEVTVGVLKMPVAVDVAYRMESVTTEEDLEAEAGMAATAEPPLQEVHFDTREEAMAFLATLLTDEHGNRYGPVPGVTRENRGRVTRFLVPEDPALVRESPHLPPPIWKEAPGFASEAELEDMFRTLAELPPVPTQGIPWDFNWGWARHDLLRYNRVEGPALGGRFESEFGSFMGPIGFRASGFFGFADLEPKARLELERASVRRRVAVGAYHELRPTDPGGRYLGLGNSLNAFFFGRDDGEYYLATGADLLFRPPETSRQSWKLRLYAERHNAAYNETDFALFRAFDGEGTFRPNMEAELLEEAGGELTLSPWWGSDPLATQFGLELYGQGAVRRHPDSTTTTDYYRAAGTLRLAVPLAQGKLRVGLEAGGGTAWGHLPLQRSWFLGGPANLRGYEASTLVDDSFFRGRLELAQVRAEGAVAWTVFGDLGWAGDRADLEGARPLYGAGVGLSVLDGLIRMDLSHGLRGPRKRLRFDLYLDAIL